MRQKDSLTAENAVLTKLAEKQRAAVEGAAELQTSTSQQVTAVEKELTAQQKLVRQYQDSLAAAERKSTDLALRNDQSIKHITEVSFGGHRLPEKSADPLCRSSTSCSASALPKLRMSSPFARSSRSKFRSRRKNSRPLRLPLLLPPHQAVARPPRKSGI